MRMTDVGRMKVAELRAELSARGLSAQGLKADLTTRLAAALESEKAFQPLSPTASPAPRALWGSSEWLEGAKANERARAAETALAEARAEASREAERHEETRLALRAAEERQALLAAENASLQSARAFATEENERLVAELAREHGACALAQERLREESAKLAKLEGLLRERDEATRAALDGHRAQLDLTAEARGAADALRRELADARQANAALVVSSSDAVDAESIADLRAVNAALEAGVSAASDEMLALKTALRTAEEALEAERLVGAEAEARATICATELEECRWREAAAGTHATNMERRAVELETRLEKSEEKVARAATAEYRAETAERDAARANEQTRAANDASKAAESAAAIAHAAAVSAAKEMETLKERAAREVSFFVGMNLISARDESWV